MQVITVITYSVYGQIFYTYLDCFLHLKVRFSQVEQLAKDYNIIGLQYVRYINMHCNAINEYSLLNDLALYSLSNYLI